MLGKFVTKSLILASSLFFGILGILSLYVIFQYLGLDFSSARNSAYSVLLVSFAIISLLISVISLLLGLTNLKVSRKFSLPFLKLIFQIVFVFYIGNIGILYTLNIKSKAQTSCYGVTEITTSSWCLLLLRPNQTGAYRVMNPKRQSTNINNPSDHQGHPCQTRGSTSSSVIVYDASPDFYGQYASTWRSYHDKVINFVSGLSIDSSKIAIDVPLCANVTVTAPNASNLVTITVATATATPTKTPTPSPRPTNTITPSPTPSADANSDGKVDGIDYTIWLTFFGNNFQGITFGDFNRSGTVDAADYAIWTSRILF